MDLSRVGYVISICEYDERGKVVLRPDFRGQRLNLYFQDLTDGVGIATEADIEKTCKFSAKWALAARKRPGEGPLGRPLRRRDIPLDGDSDDPAYRLLRERTARRAATIPASRVCPAEYARPLLNPSKAFS
jgi:hypothetical protein